MTRITSLFPTRLYRTEITGPTGSRLLADLIRASRAIAADDAAGQRWSRDNGYPGYTSYASLDDLAWRAPEFDELGKHLERHAKAFARKLQWDMVGRKLTLDSLWINILDPGGAHTSHIHPLSVLSGTTYVTMPKGASALKFEDPRLAMMIAAPTRKSKAREELRNFAYVAPAAGEVLLWESWLRHEVPLNLAEEERISVSFNYGWN